MKYIYPFGVLAALIIWGVFFLFQDKNQKLRMLKISVFVSGLGPLSQIWYLKDYWNLDPIKLPFVIRITLDLFFCFSVAGITTISLDTVLRKKWKLSDNLKLKPLFIIFYLFFALWLIIFTDFFKINSIYSTSIYLILVGLLLAWKEKVLIWAAINGIFIAFWAFICYFAAEKLFPGSIQSLYLVPKNIPNFLSVPVTEIIWYFSAGVAAYGGFKYLFSKS